MRNRFWTSSFLGAALAIGAAGAASGGCSLVVDATLTDHDAGPSSPCGSFPDGTECSVEGIAADLVCISGRCELSTCGDGVTDMRNEQCDDGNDASGDGCEPVSCDFSCASATDCDDGEICDGMETCGADHVCAAGTDATDGTTCDGDGTCQSGTCVPAGCNNGVLDMGEECDPSVSPAGSCRMDCTWTCTSDADCAAIDTSVCDGVDVCDVTMHTCGPSIALDCPDDGDACTIEACDPAMGCVTDTTTNDADGDGHYATSCGGDDCDDSSADVYTGHEEICGDHLDNDCNGMADDMTPTWYIDCDRDGYAASTTGSATACAMPASGPVSCPSGSWTSTTPTGSAIDCEPTNASVHPMQSSWFVSAYFNGTANSFDYDCSRTVEYQYDVLPDGALAFCSSLRGSCFGTSYVTSPPTCGGSNTLSHCVSTISGCTRSTQTITVGCH